MKKGISKARVFFSPPKKKHALAVNDAFKKLYPQKIATVLTYSNDWELLVAVQLSAQCTDKKVNEITQKLFKKYKTLDDYVNADPKEFEQDIFQSGFYRNKTKNILAASKMIKHEFGGKLPKSMAEMLTIPGVARKTANVVLGNAHKVHEGIAVDTHVMRLSRIFGLSKEKTPGKIEQDLIQLIPKEDWFDFTYRLIEYGRTHCPARKKDHSQEPLAKWHTN